MATSPEYDTTKVTDKDIVTVADQLSPDELLHLFDYLHLPKHKVDMAEKNADTTDVILKAKSVLRWWRQTQGRDATSKALFDARDKILRKRRLELEATRGLKEFDQPAIADTREDKAEPDDIGGHFTLCQPDDNGHFTHCHVQPALNHQRKKNLERCYDMTTREKGYAFILNLDRSYDGTHQDLRQGSEIDVVNISHVLKEVGFMVEKHIDCRAEDIEQKYEDFVKMCEGIIKAKGKLNCIPVVLMAHGGDGYIVCQPDDKSNGFTEKEIGLSDFFNRLENSKILRNIPKIFIIVSCRNKGTAGQFYQQVLPPSDHTIRIYSALPGQITTRVGGKGTIFIQALTKIILENAHRDDLLKIMRKVRSYAEELRKKEYQERNLPDQPNERPSWEENLSSDKELYLIGDSETGTS